MKIIERPAVHIALIAFLGLLAYSNTFNVPFQFDDDGYIIDNPLVKDIQFLLKPSAVETSLLPVNVPETSKTRVVAYLTFFANFKAHGIEVTGYHVVNLAIHILNALIFYFLILITFKTPFFAESGLKKKSGHIALFSALMFLLHPVQTEAVTYISQRFTSLAAFFCLLSITAYASSRLATRNVAKYTLYGVSFLSAALAMGTKENAFVLPFLISLYEVMFLKDSLKSKFFYLFPMLFTLLIIPLSVIDFDMPLGRAVADAAKTQSDISRHDYLITQFRVIATYLRLLALPIRQNLDYDYEVFHSSLAPPVLLSFLLLQFLFCFFLYLWHRARNADACLKLIAFGGLWFFIALSVESGIIPLHDVIFEHRLYLPSVGVFLAATTGGALLYERLKSQKVKAFLRKLPIFIFFALLCATYARNSIWGGKVSLWEDTVRKSPRKARPYLSLGTAYLDEGLLGKAAECYETAIKLRPDYADAHYGLGLIFLDRGLIDTARSEFETALLINPNHRNARKFLNYIKRL